MSVPIEYLLYVYCEATRRREVRLDELIQFLRTLWRNHNIAIFDSTNELIEHLQVLKNLDVIDLERSGRDIIIKIRDLNFLQRRARAVEASYLVKIDNLYRDTLNRIRQAATTKI